jgi:hypothetical protein
MNRLDGCLRWQASSYREGVSVFMKKAKKKPRKSGAVRGAAVML